MTRRVTHRVQCAEPTCGEYAHFDYDTQRERARHISDLSERPWRCVRHTAPEEVLSPATTERSQTLVTRASEAASGASFWRREGADRGGSGFTYGPGFKAYAEDFPAGTRLVITAKIELPEAKP